MVPSVNQSLRERSYAETLGWMIDIAARRFCYADYPLASVWAWSVPPARLGQSHLFVDQEGRVIGYVSWAYLTNDAASKFSTGQSSILQFSEWNAGDQLWITDFVVLYGRVRTCVRQALQLFRDSVVARFLRRDATGNIKRVCEWRRKSSFRSGIVSDVVSAKCVLIPAG